MKWVKSEGFIVDAQTGGLICLLDKHEDKLRDKMIEVAPEMFTSILSFVEQIESGTFAAKSIYNEFKQILQRVPENLIEDASTRV
jgi:hypothetical protein